MKFIAIASLGFAAVVSAQNTTVVYNCAPDSASDCTAVTSTIKPTGTATAAVAAVAASGCVAAYNTCRQPTNGVSANQAECAAENAQCQGTCYASYNTCRTSPDANRASCAADYAGCLGENPFSTDGSLTIIPVTASGSATSSAAAAQSTAECQTSYNSCRTAPDANMATCASEFAACLGTNPFASNGTNTVTGNAGAAVYTTEVVTAYTTYCPAATTLTFNGKVYTVSSATTLTVTDCPCTITKASSMPVATGSSSMATAVTSGFACNPAHSYPNGASCVSTSGVLSLVTPSASASKNGTASATTSKPVAFTGAAAHFGAGSGLVAALAGAVILI